MMLIEKEAGLKGKILRPLSAKLLPETDVEKKGLVDRSKLMDIEGRSRKPQFKLAEEYNIKDFPCPAGGCLLTYEEYAKKIRDLFANKKHVSMADIALLRIGRHFRMGKNKFVVGREETENKLLVARKTKNEYYFELPDVVGPVTILQGPKTKSAIETAAKLTAFYSDAKSGKVKVNFGRASLNESIVIAIPAQDYADNLRVGKVTK
jgi:hypothetical protein